MSLRNWSRTAITSTRASSRTFATAAPPPTTTTTPAPAPAFEHTLSPTPSSSRPTLEPLPSTPPPTPYHPYVHVPLLNFAASAPASSPSPSRLLVPLPAPLFNSPSRPSLLHKLVVAHLASLRAGTASTKNRAEVNYSGKKMRPQKGTGGARLGSRGSPMLTGGGRAFGPRPKGPDGWNRKVNRKEERLGLRVSLSDKWRTGNLSVVDRVALEEPSTRILKQRLASRGWLDALFIVGSESRDALDSQRQHAFELASGNLADVAVLSNVDDLGVWDIIKRRKVIIELGAVDEVIRRLDPGHDDVTEVDRDLSLGHGLEDALSELELETRT